MADVAGELQTSNGIPLQYWSKLYTHNRVTTTAIISAVVIVTIVTTTVSAILIIMNMTIIDYHHLGACTTRYIIV